MLALNSRSVRLALLATWGLLALNFLFPGALGADPAALWKAFSAWVMIWLAQMVPFSWAGFAVAGLWLAAALLIISGLLIGARLLGSIPDFWLRGRPRTIAVAGIGLVAASLGLQALGLVGLWFKPVFILSIAVLVLGALRFTPVLPRIRLSPMREWPLPAWFSLGVFGLMVALSRVPTHAEDPFVYHWAAIEHYLNFHKILGAPYCMAWNLPFFVEMIYAPALAFLGEDGARLANMGFLALMVLMFLELSRNRGDSNARWWGVWIFIGSFNVANTILNGKNDLGTVLFGLLALGSIMRGLNGNSAAAWIVGGIFGGALMASKLIDAGILVGIVAAACYIRKEVSWKNIALLGLGAFATAFPWYLQLWLISGNPIVPLALRIFSNPWWGPEEAKGILHGFTVWADQDLLLPTGILAGFWEMCKSGAALALLAPLALLGRGRFLPEQTRRERSFMLIAVLIAYAAWAVSPRRAVRYLFPLEPIIALLAVPQLVAPSRNLRRVLIFASCVQLVAIAGFLRPIFGGDTVPFLFGQLSRHTMIERMFTSKLEVKEWVNRNLKRTDCIWLTGEDRRFGFKPKVISQLYADKRLTWVWAKECFTAEEMAKKAKQWGVTHILLNPLSAVYRSAMWYQGRSWDDRMIRVYGDFMRRYARPIYRSSWYDYLNGQYHLFGLDRDPAKPRDFIWFLPGTEGVISPLNAPWLGKRKPSPQEYIGWTIYVTGRLGNVGSALENRVDGLIRVGKMEEAAKIMETIYRAGYEGDGTAADFSRLLMIRGGRLDDAIKAAARGARYFPGNDRLLSLGHAIMNKAIFMARKGEAARAGELADRAATIARMCYESQGVENVYYGVSGIMARLGRYREARRYADLAWARGLRGEEIEALRAYLGSPRRH